MRPASPLAWPAERLADGCEALARAAGLALAPDARRALPTPPRDARPTADWLERLGSALGIAVERVGFDREHARAVVRGAAPAVLPLDGGYALLVSTRAGRARVLAPDGALRTLPSRALAEAVAAGAGRAQADGARPDLDSAKLSERERAWIEAELARERAGTEELGGLLLRAAPDGSWRQAARGLRWMPRLAAVLGAKVVAQVLWVLSWVLIGRAALQGRLEASWLAAWVLLLACLVPLEAGTLHAAGRLAIDLGAELRSRLMAGALRLSPDVLRREGVGQALGRVLEAGALESAVLAGGFAALFACVELLTALFALAEGALPAVQVPVLLAWIALALALAWRAFAARRAWTDRRLDLSHDLVEAMVGHSTRLVQEAPERLHEAEDRSLAAYLPSARELDRAQVALTAIVPRGWMLVGLLGARAGARSAARSAPRLAVSLGGVLLAQRAFRQLVEGLSDLGAAAVACLRVEPTLRAAREAERDGRRPREHRAAPRPRRPRCRRGACRSTTRGGASRCSPAATSSSRAGRSCCWPGPPAAASRPWPRSSRACAGPTRASCSPVGSTGRPWARAVGAGAWPRRRSSTRTTCSAGRCSSTS